MSHSANQVKASLVISKYSLLATLRSPTAIVFSLLFPIIFILVFGSIVPNQAPVMKLALAPGCDTANMVFSSIRKISSISLKTGLTPQQQLEDLKKGRILAILSIKADGTSPQTVHYTTQLQTGGAAPETLGLLETVLNAAIGKINQKIFPGNASVTSVVITKVPGRVYRTIDFILPGQLGFSLLMAGVYGSSFLLFSLRKGLVLKRLQATPVKRRSIITGEMLSRLFFQVLAFLVMVALGYFVFHFTLVNGVVTLLEMLLFSLFGLFIFMGIGFIISGVVQNENSITPIANTIVLPQILLCGLFFPVENYPHRMQEFCNLLPLTFFVDGMRKIAFEGTHIWQMPLPVGGLIIWTLIICPIAVKSFKWE
jgi:ABC-2 type transport system permease protein